MKNIRLALTFVLSMNALFSQEGSRTVFGIVSDDFGILKDVYIKIQGKSDGVVSDNYGKYEIIANEGDVLVFSHMGMLPTEITIEDVTRVLNVKLYQNVEELDNVTVAKELLRSQDKLAIAYNSNPSLIKSAFGILDKETASFSLRILDENEINEGARDISYVLNGRFAGVNASCNPSTNELIISLRPLNGMGGGSAGGVVYDVDGQIFDRLHCTFVDPSNIKRIAVIPSLSAALLYGGIASGGIVIINTKTGNVFLKDKDGNPIDLARSNDNIYSGNLINYESARRNAPEYLKELHTTAELEEATKVYEKWATQFTTSFYYFLDAYDYFNGKWKNAEFAEELITENWNVFENNPIALKSLAYTYQAEGDFKKANELYKEIFILRPHYAQSYLDLANSYGEIGEYQKSAAIYARYGYLLEEDFLNDEKKNFTQIMDRELNNLITLKGRDLLSKRDLKKFTLEEDFDGTRLVFEWADSEAEFELQFVNPQNRYFKWNHTMRDNMERIQDEKAIGFSTEEYLIDEALLGNWQVNVKYLGNKSLTPTYLKATVYHNYGSVAQRKEVKVFKLSLLNVNQELFKVSNTGAVVSK